MMAGWISGEQTTLAEVFALRLTTDPSGPYLEFDTDGAFDAAGVDALAQRCAAGLADLGVERGDRVATLLDNGIEIVVTFFAAMRLGAVLVPVNTAYKGEFLRHQLADSGAVVLVHDATYSDRVGAVAGEVASLTTCVPTGAGWDELLDSGRTVPAPAEVAPSDLAMLVYTAGTTGASKGCMLSHNYVACLARQIATTWQREPEDVVWTPLPLFHLNAWVNAVVGTLLVGGSAAIARRFSVSGFWAEMNRTGATIASLLGAPAVFIAKAADDPEQERNTTLRLVAAAPMSAAVDAVYRDRFGVATFSAGYGLTEVSLISMLPPGEENRPGAAGRVNDAEFEVAVFDDDDAVVEAGTVGEIVVRPRRPNVMFAGYWGRPDATMAQGRNWWFHTGDLGRVDAEGFLYFVDRKKDYLRRRGENVSSYEMEAAFAAHPDIAEVAVHAVASPDATEDEVKVTAVLKAGSQISPEQLCRWSMDRVPYFAVPRYVELRDDLPRNPVGRVLKYELRAEGVTETTWDRVAAGVEVPR